MTIFKNSETAERLFREFWNELIQSQGFDRKLKQEGINILFEINDPDLAMYIDENGPLFGEEIGDRIALITIKMNGDLAHRYWLDQVDIPTAMTRRQLRARGPVNKFLQLRPLLNSGIKLYSEYCDRYNLPQNPDSLTGTGNDTKQNRNTLVPCS